MRGQTSENRYGNEFGTRATVSTNFAIAVHLMARCNIQTFVEIIHCSCNDLPDLFTFFSFF